MAVYDIGDFVEETANNPGTSATVTLAGAAAGARTFLSRYAANTEIPVGMHDGSQGQIVMARVLSSPARIQILKVLENTAGTTARLSFTGSVRVFAWAAGQLLPLLDETTRKLPADLLPYQAGEHKLREVVVSSPIGAVDLTLDAGYSAFRLIVSGFAPASLGIAYARFSQGAGFLAGDFDYFRGAGVFGPAINASGGGSETEITLTDGTVEQIFFEMRFSRPAAGRINGTFDAYQLRNLDGITSRVVGAFRVIPAAMGTAVRIGFKGINTTAGRAVLLGVPDA
ncbi:hypothetical protein [Roseomonas sp. USHLN139]|uniref:hypothetical protein n=1 Tax=Roseomonas sp. USHLN139 TaxID=3081298 RepID=UPI003B01E45A